MSNIVRRMLGRISTRGKEIKELQEENKRLRKQIDLLADKIGEIDSTILRILSPPNSDRRQWIKQQITNLHSDVQSMLDKAEPEKGAGGQ